MLGLWWSRSGAYGSAGRSIWTNLTRPCGLRSRLSLHRRGSSSQEVVKTLRKTIPNLADIPMSHVRNWAVIAHIDHGKSTLSDRLLELTKTISPDANNRQVLDKLKVEQERGITVKAQTASMVYNYNGEDYLLNLIDTPGHVDFRTEVSRSLAACQGCILLIDATQGIQAQTVANFYLAFSEGLVIVPVLNKIDMPTADAPRVLEQLNAQFDIDPAAALQVSAKTGLGVDTILPTIIEKIPPPSGSPLSPLKALLIDSWYDNYVGVIALIYVKDGVLTKGQKISSHHTGIRYEVSEVGIMYPDRTPVPQLYSGQVGYMACGMKRSFDAHIGDTFYRSSEPVEPFPGFEPVKPMVYVGAFPVDSKLFEQINDSIEHLILNDRSITVEKESSTALGMGWRIGFLGTLHLSVFVERLRDEHGGEVIITAPTVPFKIVYTDGTERLLSNPREFPDSSELSVKVASVEEPMVDANITVPSDYLGAIIELCESSRGRQLAYNFLSESRVFVKYRLPLAILVENFFGKLKGLTKGYASLDYEDCGYEASDLVKLMLLVNKVPVDALCVVTHRSQVERKGREWVQRLKPLIERQQFEVVIQAAVGKKIIARETIKAVRKDVTAKLYGGDWTRRMKLLEKQKKGKAKLQKIGTVSVDQKAFHDFLSQDSP